MTPENLRDLYVQQLRDLRSTEKQLLDMLPTMAGKAQDASLQDALWEHLEEVRRHEHRLDKLFEDLEVSHNGQTCYAMKGIIREANNLISNASRIFGSAAPPEVLDAGLIAQAQRAVHYKVAVYGTVATYAELLERADDLKLLRQTLEEEKQMDAALTRVATELVNPAAQKLEQKTAKA